VRKDSRWLGKAALPYGDDAPPFATQEAGVLAIPANVAIELRQPELDVCARRGRSLAPFVAMPETPMNEDDRLCARENEIGLPRHPRHILLEADTKGLEHKRDLSFRGRLDVPNL
jgi:hypothetical protein